MKRASDDYAHVSAELKTRRQESRKEAEQEFMAAKSNASARHNSERLELEERYARRLKDLEVAYAREAEKLQRGFAQATADWDARFEQAWQAMAQQWLAGVEDFETAGRGIAAFCRRMFPSWDSTAWDDWSPPTAIPPVIPFGHLQVGLDDFEGGVPQNPELLPEHTRFCIPALLAFRDHSLLL